MSNLRKTLAAIALCHLGVCAQVVAGPLVDAETSWDGGEITYPDGQPRITSVILRIDEGDEPPFHCHPIPTMGYVLKGEIEVETADGKKAVFREGEAVVEVMRTVHRGRALVAPVEIVVFYAGSVDLPTTILPGDDPAQDYCDR